MAAEFGTGQAFWLLVGTGIVIGILVADRCARLWKLDPDIIHSLVPWALIPGFFGAHLLAVGLYRPDAVQEDPWVLLEFWSHISSIGGMLGGTAGIWFYLRRRSVELWDYIDAIAVGFTVAWIFGRLGCTFVFDHPGLETDFFLAMRSPEGMALPALFRHNLGLYEVFWAAALATVFFTQLRRRHFRGWYLRSSESPIAPSDLRWISCEPRMRPI